MPPKNSTVSFSTPLEDFNPCSTTDPNRTTDLSIHHRHAQVCLANVELARKLCTLIGYHSTSVIVDTTKRNQGFNMKSLQSNVRFSYIYRTDFSRLKMCMNSWMPKSKKLLTNNWVLFHLVKTIRLQS
jgi:hypothetical protein